MTDSEIRFECLKLSFDGFRTSNSNVSANDVIRDADNYFRFVSGRSLLPAFSTAMGNCDDPSCSC